MQNMGFGKLASSEVCFKRKYRWLFFIPDISQDGVNALPPSKAARPNLSFKEMDAQHLNETIYYPSKPEWKPITLVLYDINTNTTDNPVWNWITRVYDPDEGTWNPSCSPQAGANGKPGLFKINRCKLEMYDGCGNVLEKWVYEGAWCQQVEFGDLDMGDSNVSTIDITLRYDRAYID